MNSTIVSGEQSSVVLRVVCLLQLQFQSTEIEVSAVIIHDVQNV